MKSNRELRKFGITMGIAFGLIGALLLWRERAAWPYLLGLSVFFFLFGLVFPRALVPIEWAWMKLAHYLSIVMTYLLVTLTFFIVITPMGLLLRLLGKDLLALKFEKERRSYWEKVDPEGPAGRPEKPY